MRTTVLSFRAYRQELGISITFITSTHNAREKNRYTKFGLNSTQVAHISPAPSAFLPSHHQIIHAHIIEQNHTARDSIKPSGKPATPQRRLRKKEGGEKIDFCIISLGRPCRANLVHTRSGRFQPWPIRVVRARWTLRSFQEALAIG